jgi:hypothetical protein
MFRPLAVWLWRLAVLAALLWIGWELHRLRVDLAEPLDDQGDVAVNLPACASPAWAA